MSRRRKDQLPPKLSSIEAILSECGWRYMSGNAWRLNRFRINRKNLLTALDRGQGSTLRCQIIQKLESERADPNIAATIERLSTPFSTRPGDLFRIVGEFVLPKFDLEDAEGEELCRQGKPQPLVARLSCPTCSIEDVGVEFESLVAGRTVRVSYCACCKQGSLATGPE